MLTIYLSIFESYLCVFLLLAIDIIDRKKKYKTRDRDKELKETIARDKNKSTSNRKKDWEIQEKVEAIEYQKIYLTRIIFYVLYVCSKLYSLSFTLLYNKLQLVFY